jgi:hypothetical protein
MKTIDTKTCAITLSTREMQEVLNELKIQDKIPAITVAALKTLGHSKSTTITNDK